MRQEQNNLGNRGDWTSDKRTKEWKGSGFELLPCIGCPAAGKVSDDPKKKGKKVLFCSKLSCNITCSRAGKCKNGTPPVH